MRTFVDVYQGIFFLNSFAKLNKMACQQALRKLVRKFLVERENVLDKKMMLVTKKNEFFNADQLKDLESELLQFYAKCFTNDNLEEAKRIIKFDHSD